MSVQAQDLNYTLWMNIARLCPIQCQVSHITDEDYKDDGTGVRKATFNFVCGTLTAVEEQYHWRFDHPGLKGGSIRIHTFMSDTTPGYKGVHFQ